MAIFYNIYCKHTAFDLKKLNNNEYLNITISYSETEVYFRDMKTVFDASILLTIKNKNIDYSLYNKQIISLLHRGFYEKQENFLFTFNGDKSMIFHFNKVVYISKSFQYIKSNDKLFSDIELIEDNEIEFLLNAQMWRNNLT